MAPHPYIKSVTFTPDAPPKFAGRTREEWVQLAASTTHRITHGQHEQIADECVAMAKRGENPVVWHAASIVFGQLDSCPCNPCVIARKAR